MSTAHALVRCTECEHGRTLHPGCWCPVAGRNAGGRYPRACAHYAVPAGERLERLRGLPGVATAEEREGWLWVRFHRHATSEQRDRLTALLTGRRPTLRRFTLKGTKPRSPARPTKPRRGGTAA